MRLSVVFGTVSRYWFRYRLTVLEIDLSEPSVSPL